MTTVLTHAVNIYKELRERIAKEFDLEHDDQALLDTLEGASDLPDMIVRIARFANETGAQADALKSIIADNQVRLKRLLTREENIRNAIAWAMQDAALPKVMAPDMTISQRKGSDKLTITCDPDQLPPKYRTEKTVYSPDRDAIKADLQGGTSLAFAYLSNSGPVLAIRTK